MGVKGRVAQVGDKAQRWGEFQKCEDTMQKSQQPNIWEVIDSYIFFEHMQVCQFQEPFYNDCQLFWTWHRYSRFNQLLQKKKWFLEQKFSISWWNLSIYLSICNMYNINNIYIYIYLYSYCITCGLFEFLAFLHFQNFKLTVYGGFILKLP